MLAKLLIEGVDWPFSVMSFQFSSTTRLRHINYPENQPRVPAQWEQTETSTTQLHKTSPFSLEANDDNNARNQSQIDQGNNMLTNHRKETLKSNGYRSENILPAKITSKGLQNSYSTHHLISRHITTSPQSTAIEIDVLESFSEFAAFLELQNPICPAEHLDTPEKLMSVLAWDVWVQ